MHLLDLLRKYFSEYGYWTIAVVLLFENTGIPLPGETTLLFAAALAFSEHKLSLWGIIVVGVVACTLGDNLGYWIGRRGGRPLLDRQRRVFRISEAHLARGERFFRRYGNFTVFFARFVFGLRILAGPLAGVLRMPWEKFVLFNFLGAVLWVSVVASLGYFFGSRWEWFMGKLDDLQLVFVALAIIGLLLLWRRERRRTSRAR